jgi:5-methylcytosine-specific restriction endonuclease McrA
VPGNPFYSSSAWRALRAAALARDGYRCNAAGCRAPATHVDHIVTRPPLPVSTPQDRLDNLRSLCSAHDRQVKELAGGRRRRGGVLRPLGCDAGGWPF